VHQISY